MIDLIAYQIDATLQDAPPAYTPNWDVAVPYLIRSMHGYCMNKGHHPDDIPDLIGDALERLARKHGAVWESESAMYSYAYQGLRHAIIDRYRAYQAKPTAPLEAARHASIDPVEHSDLVAIIHRAIMDLAPLQRQTFAALIDGYKPREIAEMSGLRRQTIYSALDNARERLARVVAAYDQEAA